MGRGLGPYLLSLKLLCAVVQSNSSSPPGKPALLGCRSPEKETFSCWWRPGSSGGLPTTHRLYYERERLVGTHECPDYLSAGHNSCFFNKSHTVIWVEYNLTVVAHNALGHTTSDTYEVDVMDIVKPNAPDNVTVRVEEKEHGASLHIDWGRPLNTDTESGWVTVRYQVRVKQRNNQHQWKEYTTGTQTHLSLFGLNPGGAYVVQVRGRIDHGQWSEWSSATCVTVPDNLHRGKVFWILVFVLSVIALIVSMWILVIKRNYVSRCILPPVPSPKIPGVDFQPLKNKQPEHMTNALTLNPNFPLMAAWTEQVEEEYLVVTENDNKLLSDALNAQRMKQSPVRLPGSGLNLKRHHERLMPFQEAVRTDPHEESLSYTLVSQVPSGKQYSDGSNFATVELTDTSRPANHLHPAANSGYVDILKQCGEELDFGGGKLLNGDDAQLLTDAPVTPSADYSRVREVDADRAVLLQGHAESA